MAERSGPPAPPLAMTMGEPAGIGPETALMAWRHLRETGPAFFVLGDAAFLSARGLRAGVEVPVREIATPEEAAEVFAHALPVLPLAEARDLPDAPGTIRAETAPAVMAAISGAVDLVLAGRAAGMVTLPIQKEALYEAGFDFEGHTDYLADLARRAGHVATPVMMLTAQDLRTVPVTVHIPLEDVPARLATDAIIRQGRVLAHDLARFFGLARPRIAVAGLNPHAGEGGRMGREEDTIIRPAIEALREDGIDATGPLPADTMFHPEARASYDAALCMYHDQALIPVKTLDFHGGVNVTLGLPFVRTSPDHGTALTLAATGHARPDSLLAALHLAAAMARATHTTHTPPATISPSPLVGEGRGGGSTR